MPEALENTRGDRAPLQPGAEAGRGAAAGVSGAGGSSTEEFLRARGRARASTRALAAARDGRGAGRVPRSAWRSSSTSSASMGFAGYFLIVARLHPLGARERRAGRPGPRLGRRLAGGLRLAHHRPRSAAARPAVRALPESRARVDAGLRHRLLHGRARPGHRLRGRQVRARARLADHHLRHHGGEGGGARRRPRAGHELRLRRPHRQADSVRARHHARRCAREGAGAASASTTPRRRSATSSTWRARSRADAQRRHARRRRGDRALGAHRLRAAVLRSRLAAASSRSSTRTTSRRRAW